MSVYGKAIVLGFGDSGESAARLLLSEKTDVTVVDQADNDLLRRKKDQLEGAEVILGCSDLPDDEFDVCIVSPGVSSSSRLLMAAESRMPVISELELGATRCDCPVIGVTGSNGKSTMVKLCNDALRLSGRKSEIAGNYGTPICDLVKVSDDLDWLVVEVSSFQLEHIDTFAPELRVLLNIQPDHLDRHGTFDEYCRQKMRLFNNMKTNDVGIVLESEMPRVSAAGANCGKFLSFGLSDKADYRYCDGQVIWSENADVIDIKGSYFDNPVLGLTAAASVGVLTNCGISPRTIESAVADFVPLRHRMEEIRRLDGIRYIDDSKATNLTAMCAGIQMAHENVRLIAGGQLKEKTSPKIKEVLVKYVKSIYLIGESSNELHHAWSDSIDCKVCANLQDAVAKARKDAVVGDVVLLSPGCASFDQFQNYKDRGNQFREIVNKEM